MARPIIGITSPLQPDAKHTAGEAEVTRHARLLERLGAATVVLPRGESTGDALSRLQLQGILFSGGGDVSSALYGGSPELSDDRVDPDRDAGELALLRNAFAARVPTLCVCRGLQLANIAFGGTLVEDIKSELGADYRISHHQERDLNRPATEATHEVHLESTSLLAAIIGTNVVWTNSLHHQAIRTLAPPLASTGRTDDGIIEAIELIARDFFFQGVQWHPESLPDDAASIRLYSALIEAAAAFDRGIRDARSSTYL